MIAASAADCSSPPVPPAAAAAGAAACSKPLSAAQPSKPPSMEAYPPELTSPPLPLVALIGAPELLPPIADYLRTQHAPRLNALGIPDAHSAAGAFGASRSCGSLAGCMGCAGVGLQARAPLST